MQIVNKIDSIIDRVCHNYLFIAIVLLPYFEPDFFADCLPPIHMCYLALEAVSIVCVAFLIIWQYCVRHRQPPSVVLILIAIFQLYLCIDTFIQNGNTINILKASASVICIAFLVESLARVESDGMLKVLRVYFVAYVAVTVITTLVFPDGLYVASDYGERDTNAIRYFAGHKNQIVPSLTPGFIACAVIWLRSHKRSDAGIAIGYAVCLLVVAAISDSVTSVIVSIILLLALLLSTSKSVQKVHAMVWLLIAGVVDVALTILKVQDLVPGLVKMLGRRTTFSGRTTIWSHAQYAISQAPVFGHGVVRSDVAREQLNGFQTAHNIFFTTTYYGGFVGLLLLICCLVAACVRLGRNRGAIATFLALAIFAVLVNGVFETLGMGLTALALPLAMAGSCDALSKTEESARHYAKQ